MTLVVVRDPPALAAFAADQLDRWLAPAHPGAVMTLALSGGSTPIPTLELLGDRAASWWRWVAILQVDEREVPPDHADRNLAMLERTLLDRVAVGAVHPMPVGASEPDRAYEAVLRSVCGEPPVIDVVVLGLGADGHTASLVPGDPVLDLGDELAVGRTQPYHGHRRVTMTASVLRRARRVVWLVAGTDKAAALAAVLGGDTSLPAGAVMRPDHVVVADEAAAEHCPRG
ncbi:MAG: 6-phosphogluconolactonase [Acidimicrobiales bacterium]|nr:6-phosphogluconolactonase [Acidimicrobiales bacterium]